MRQLIIIIILCAVSLAVQAPKNHVLDIFKFKPIVDVGNPAQWLNSIIWVESGQGTYNSQELEAVGILQQHPIFVRDVNRIVGYEKYSLDDRNDPHKAIQMFFIYQNFYNPDMNFEVMCKLQCGGPNGMNKSCTEKYYQAVRDKLYSDKYR